MSGRSIKMNLFIPLLIFVGTAGLAQGQAPVESKAEVIAAEFKRIFWK